MISLCWLFSYVVGCGVWLGCALAVVVCRFDWLVAIFGFLGIYGGFRGLMVVLMLFADLIVLVFICVRWFVCWLFVLVVLVWVNSVDL